MQHLLINYWIWNGSPELFTIQNLTLRWDAFLFILGFLLSRQLLLLAYRKYNIPYTISAFGVYLALSALVGSRLIFILLNEPESFVSKFHTIFLPFEFEPSFSLLARNQFSVHGAVLGIFAFIVFYKRKLRLPYLQALDGVTLPCALAGIFVCLGSFMSSGIPGKQTASRLGIVSTDPVERGLLKVPCCIMRSPDGKNPLDKVFIRKHPGFAKAKTSQPPIIIYLFFSPGLSEQLVNEFLVGDVKTFLYDMASYVHEPGTQPLQYQVFLQQDGTYIARVVTRGIARFPVQVIEALALLTLFFVLGRRWLRRSDIKPPGRLFALFMVSFWSVHLLIQFMKASDHALLLGFINVSILLDILFIFAGVVSLFLSFGKTPSLQR